MGAVAGCEFRLQRRAPLLWILIALVTAATVFVAVTKWSGTPNSSAAALMVTETDALFATILLPWLFVATFARDTRRRFESLLWARPLAPSTYALGKGLVCAALGMLVVMPPLLVGWASVIIVWQTAALGPWLAMIGIASGAAIPVALFAVLCIRLTPWPLLGALVSSGLTFYLAFLQTQTLLHVTDLAASTAFISPSIGLGPDGPLLLAQRFALVAFGFLCLSVLLLVVQMTERRAATLRSHRLRATAATVVAALLLLIGFASFRATAMRFAALGPAPASPLAATVTQYQLTLTLDPATGRVEGTASFLLTPTQASRVARFSLNPGLQVRAVTLKTGSERPSPSAVAVPFQSRVGWTRVALDGTAFAHGEPIRLTIAYGGQLALNRDDYAQARPGVSLNGAPATLGEVLPVSSYVGHGIAFLEGVGDWYPLPWTEQAVALAPARTTFAAVQVRIPAGLAVFSSLGTPTPSADGRWQFLTLQRPGPLPMATLAVLSDPQRRDADGAMLVYQGTPPSATSALFDQIVLDQVQVIDNWLNPTPAGTARHWIGVFVPLLAHPAVGSGFVLLPETPDRSLVSAARVSATARVRVPAQEAAMAWWRDAVPAAMGRPGYTNMPPDTQAPNGRVALAEYPAPLLFSTLASYSGAVSTDRTLGHNYLAQELATRERYQVAASRPSPERGESAADQAMDSLGLPRDPHNPSLALFMLGQRVGPARMAQFLRRFGAAHAVVPTTMQDLTTAADGVAGLGFWATVVSDSTLSPVGSGHP